MLAVLEMIEEENKRIFAQGERRGIKKEKRITAKKMLQKNIAQDIIIEVTGLKSEEIEKMAKQKNI